MHIGYFALHLLVGIGIVVQRLFKYHLKNRNFAYGLGVLGLYIILNLIMTGSKMGFLTLLTMLGVSLILMLSRGVGWKKVLIAAAGILVILTVLVKQTSFLAKRFERMTVSTPIDPDTIESTQARRMCWICAKDVFVSNIWLGLGTGDTQDAMMDCYEDKGFRGPASKELGPHSQYLESGIAAGILTSITLFLMLFIPLLRAFKLKHIASTMFFLAFLMACVSESIFERAMGIHLYSVMLGVMLMWMEMRRQDLLSERSL
jgi:O-antigen ligase